MFAGASIGGLLAKPDGRLTSIQLFRSFPYALPCLVAGVLTVSGAFACAAFLEKPPHKEVTNDSGPLRSVFHREILLVFLFQAFVNLFGFSYTALFPLWLFTPVSLGGLSMPVQTVGAIMALGTFRCDFKLIVSVSDTLYSQAIWLLVLMPKLDRKLGTRKLMQCCFLAWPFFFATPILSNWLVSRGHVAAMWVVLVTASCLGTGISMAFSLSSFSSHRLR
jgi:hypothetical protein